MCVCAVCIRGKRAILRERKGKEGALAEIDAVGSNHHPREKKRRGKEEED